MNEFTVSNTTIKSQIKRFILIIIMMPITVGVFAIMALRNEDTIDPAAPIVIPIILFVIFPLIAFVAIMLGKYILSKTSIKFEDNYFILKKIRSARLPILKKFKVNYTDIESIKQTNYGIVIKKKKSVFNLVIPKVIDNCEEIYKILQLKISSSI